MFGTSSWRVPSGFARSIASPRFTWADCAIAGLPSSSVKPAFIAGRSAMASTTAKPSRCVKETLPPRVRARWLLMTIRLSTSIFAGIDRTEVAVGTVRLASMFVTTRAAGPRSRCTSSTASVRARRESPGPGCAYGAVAGRAVAIGWVRVVSTVGSAGVSAAVAAAGTAAGSAASACAAASAAGALSGAGSGSAALVAAGESSVTGIGATAGAEPADDVTSVVSEGLAVETGGWPTVGSSWLAGAITGRSSGMAAGTFSARGSTGG